MLYALLLYGAEEEGATPSQMPPETAAAWAAFEGAASEAGAFRGWQALAPTPGARTLRVAGGRPVVTDGPFAETREQLGGFYLLECADLDEALRWATRMPCAPDGSIEVRAVIAGASVHSTPRGYR